MDDSDDNTDNAKNIFGFKKKKNTNNNDYDEVDWDNQDNMDLRNLEEANLYHQKPQRKPKNTNSFPKDSDSLDEETDDTPQRRNINDYQNDDDDDYNEDEQYKNRKFYDKDKPQNTLSKLIFKIVFALIIIIIAAIILLNQTSNRYRGILQIPDSQSISFEEGEVKLDKPIIGDFDNADEAINNYNQSDTISPPQSEPLPESDALSNIDFDFSPIMKNQIAREPMLPDKIKEENKTKKQSTTDELQNLWSDNTDEESASSPHNTATLPAWRRFAIDYQPTNGLPIFSVILEYDKDILFNHNNLPKHSGYNVVVSGFSSVAQKNIKILKDKQIETLLYLPMEENTEARNLNPIKTTSSYDEIRDAIAFHTSQMGGSGFVGFMNYKGSQTRKTISKINFAMSIFTKTGYLYLDDNRDNEQSYAYAAALGQKVPALKTNIYIESVKDEFINFLNKVKLEGNGIAIVRATPQNIQALNAYENLIVKNKLMRIPLTGILKNKSLNASAETF